MTIAVEMRRLATACLVVPVTLFLTGGPLAASAYADARTRRDALLALAARQGIDPELLVDPDGYARRMRAQAKERRKAALATLPKSEPSLWAQAEFSAVQEAQARHTLAGLGRELREGRKIDERKLSPLVLKLRDEARRSPVRRKAVPRPAERMTERLVAPTRVLRAQAPASWRDAMARDLRSGGLQPQTLIAPPQPAVKPNVRAVAPRLCRKGDDCAASGHRRGRVPADCEEPVSEPTPHPNLTLEQGIAHDYPLPATPASLVATIDAPSTHPLIVQKAQALGNDPIRIYNFVHDTIMTELYAGSKKGAIGTLREGTGNDVDQASLLIALLRAANIPARYEVGNLAFPPAQANEYAGVAELSVSSALLSSAGIPNTFVQLGTAQGIGLQIEHTWVRAQVPDTAYRGVTRPGAELSWAHLAPAIKQMKTRDAVDLRDAVVFDFNEYLNGQKVQTPVEAYEDQLRAYVRTSATRCPTLDDAQKTRTIVPAALELLPSELPVRRMATLSAFAELPPSERHSVLFESRSSLGTTQFSYSAPMVSLWGKSVTLLYAPATATDAALITQYGGLENTPAYRIKLRATLKVDAVTVVSGVPENAGIDQRMFVESSSPATGKHRVEHPTITTGGVYAFGVDPGVVPEDLITERMGRFATLTGDDLEGEKLYTQALTYLRGVGTSRVQLAGLHWHRLYKEIETIATEIVPRVEELNGVPLSISRDYFVVDAPLRFGDFSIDGNHSRTVRLVKLSGYQSSVLEHRLGEQFQGSRHFSAVKLLQIAREGAIPILTFTSGTVDEALATIAWPLEREESLRASALQGLTVQAPTLGHFVSGLPALYGYIATNPSTGAAKYIVGSVFSDVNGNMGDIIDNNDAGADHTGGHCPPETGPARSACHLLSGKLVDDVTDLILPARGFPLTFTRSYTSGTGWTHNYSDRLTPQGDGSLQYRDVHGNPWSFAASGPGSWLPPPKLFQRIESSVGGWVMRFKDGTLRRFDSLGRLASIEDANGHAATLTYDSNGRLAVVGASGGSALGFGYDPQGRLATVGDSAGRLVTYTFDGPHIASATDVRGHTRNYVYDASGRMVSKTNARGQLTRYGHDDLGRLTRYEDAAGGSGHYAYDHRYRRTTHTDSRGYTRLFQLSLLSQIVRHVDPLGNERAFSYDTRGNLTSAQDARGNTTAMTYDADGNLLTRTDPAGATTTYVYGTHARLTAKTDALDNTTTRTYDSRGNLLTSTNALNQVTSFTYTTDGLIATVTLPGAATTQLVRDAAGNVVLGVDPEGRETTMTYNAAGHLLTRTDGGGATDTMTVDATGRVLTVEDGVGALTTLQYDADGNRTLVTDPQQRSTLFAYDAESRLIATTDPLGQTTRQEYDGEGNLIARIDSRGHRSEYGYDALGRLVQSCDALGNCTDLQYCADVSRVVSDVVDPLGNTTHIECDEFGREASRTDPLGHVSHTSYDLLGRRASVTSAAGHTMTFGYDALGRIDTVTDPMLGVTRVGYDARGNRSTVTDALDRTTHFDYDLANQLIAESTPTNTSTQYDYEDSGGRAVKVDAKGQETLYAYDPEHRLTDITYDDNTTATFDYDLRGRRTLESNADSTRELSYDALGRLERVDDIESGRTIDYRYDAAGNRISMRVSPGDATTSYAWDARGLLVRMTDPEGGRYDFGYDELGRRVSTHYPNGMTLTQVYDAASRLLAMNYGTPGGAVIESFSYAYDTRGNRTAKVYADGSAEQYGYDALSRLVRVAYPSGREVHYRYDAVGNRIEMTEGTTGGPAATCASDQDCDGTLDATDNCPSIANPSQQDSDAPTPDAVSVWRFDEATGTSAQDVLNTNHGTMLSGASRFAPGRFGRSALVLDGVNDRVEVANSTSLRPTTALSMEAWVYPTRTGQTETILEKGTATTAGYGLYMCSGGRPAYHIKVTGGLQSAASATLLALNQWHHVAVSFDSARTDRTKLYVNGVEVTETGVSGCITRADQAGVAVQDSANLQLGSRQGTSSFFQGRVDEAAVWSRPLTGAEVSAHFQGTLFGDRIGDACDACPQSTTAACAPTTCLDADGDGYGVQGATFCPGGVSAFDCDDSSASIHPGTPDLCDDIDNDCDGRRDEGCLANPQTTTYAYNAFNQLQSATTSAGTTSFSYDANGNLLSEAAPGATTSFTWDARDRMTQLTLPDTTTRSFGYDTANLRVRTQDSASTRRILLDGMVEHAEYAAGSGAELARYDHDPSHLDGLLAQRAAASKVHAVTDELGSIHALTNAASAAVSRYGYDVYGARTPAIETVPTKFGFAGRVHDGAASEAIYGRERFYQPRHGRWLSPDPSGVSDGPNRYPYVHANPVNMVDPTGLFAIVFIGSSIPVNFFNGAVHADNLRRTIHIQPMDHREEILGMLVNAGMLPSWEVNTAHMVPITGARDVYLELLFRTQVMHSSDPTFVIYVGHATGVASGSVDPGTGLSPRISLADYAEAVSEGLGWHRLNLGAFAACNTAGEDSAGEVLSDMTRAPVRALHGEGFFAGIEIPFSPGFSNLTLFADIETIAPLMTP